MRNGLRYPLLGAAACLAPLVQAAPARAAGTLTVTSIAPNPFAIGRIGAAHSNNGGTGGSTVFTFSPTSNSVTVTSGGGTAAHTTSTAPFIVTVNCNNTANCTGDNGAIVILTRTGRTNNPALSNFTYGSAGGTPITPTSSGTLTFTLPNINKNTSKTFGIGMDFSVDGDNAAGTSGAATATFEVQVGTGTPSGSTTATISATIYRGISMVQTSNMQFGRIARAAGGAGNVIVNNSTGVVSVTGSGLAPAPGASYPTSRALFTLYGEGGQAFTLNVPTTFVMTQGTNSLTVTTSPSSANGTQNFGGSIGSYGSLSLGIGGTVPLTAATTLGSYTGTFQVTAVYN